MSYTDSELMSFIGKYAKCGGYDGLDGKYNAIETAFGMYLYMFDCLKRDYEVKRANYTSSYIEDRLARARLVLDGYAERCINEDKLVYNEDDFKKHINSCISKGDKENDIFTNILNHVALMPYYVQFYAATRGYKMKNSKVIINKGGVTKNLNENIKYDTPVKISKIAKDVDKKLAKNNR